MLGQAINESPNQKLEQMWLGIYLAQNTTNELNWTLMPLHDLHCLKCGYHAWSLFWVSITDLRHIFLFIKFPSSLKYPAQLLCVIRVDEMSHRLVQELTAAAIHCSVLTNTVLTSSLFRSFVTVICNYQNQSVFADIISYKFTAESSLSWCN